MNTLYKVLVWVALAASFAGFVSKTELMLGGTTNYDQLDTTDGYSVDGTSVINGSGVWTGAISGSNSLSVTGDVRVKVPVQTGSVTALTGGATSSASAADVCDSSVLTRSPTVANSSTTLPTAAAMFADCLTTNGDSMSILFRNLSNAASTTIIAANTSSTLVGPSANDDIIDGANEAKLKFIRASATEMVVIVEEQVAAD